MMQTSYARSDVTLLLKDITGMVQPLPTQERERMIQSGTHYCEMLPLEYRPSGAYMKAYQQALELFARPTANAVGCLADRVQETRGPGVVLVSLARAGIPIGILLKRYLEKKFQIQPPHYAISIIRGRGIDENAIEFLLKRYDPARLLFVDGWIGKGAILGQLTDALKAYPDISPELAVVADPANMTRLYGTREDILIPSSCLNSTVSGLISRTFLRADLIGPSDFHGAAYYGDLQAEDLSYHFIQAIEREFSMANRPDDAAPVRSGIEEAQEVAAHLAIPDINLVKPGIGETTRVLLRRVPWKVLVRDDCRDDVALRHIIQLAGEKNVPIESYPLKNYKACGIIRQMADT